MRTADYNIRHTIIRWLRLGQRCDHELSQEIRSRVDGLVRKIRRLWIRCEHSAINPEYSSRIIRILFEMKDPEIIESRLATGGRYLEGDSAGTRGLSLCRYVEAQTVVRRVSRRQCRGFVRIKRCCCCGAARVNMSCGN